MKTKIYKCEKCSTEVNDSQKFCHSCGTCFDKYPVYVPGQIAQKFRTAEEYADYMIHMMKNEKNGVELAAKYFRRNANVLPSFVGSTVWALIKKKEPSLYKKWETVYYKLDGDYVDQP